MPPEAASSVRAYWVNRPGAGAIETTPLPRREGALRLKTLATGVSPGTERLVGLGRVATGDYDAMRCAYMEGAFSFPLKYGYALVGVDDAKQRAFVMHPHQTMAVVDPDDTVPIPDAIPTMRALLFPALETAQNAIWDAELDEGERVTVVGGGLIGVAIAYLLHKSQGTSIRLVEASGDRREFLKRFAWLDVQAPDRNPDGTAPTCLFHCSASESGLQWCIDHSAFEARVMELSWYGDRRIRVALGSSFHYGRKRIISSQVAHVARPVRSRLGREGRRAAILDHLADKRLDDFIGPVRDFSELPALMDEIYRGSSTMMLPAIVYSGE